MDLNLSDSQRDQVIKIMETHQIDRVKARGDLIKDRDNLRKALQADKVNEQGVRKAYKKLSSVREDMLISRTKNDNRDKSGSYPRADKNCSMSVRPNDLTGWNHSEVMASRLPADCPATAPEGKIIPIKAGTDR